MEEFLAVYIGHFSPEEKAQVDLSEEQQQEGMLAWGRWIEENSASIDVSEEGSGVKALATPVLQLQCGYAPPGTSQTH